MYFSWMQAGCSLCRFCSLRRLKVMLDVADLLNKKKDMLARLSNCVDNSSKLENDQELGLSGSGRTSYRRHSKSIVTQKRGKMFTGDLGDRA